MAQKVVAATLQIFVTMNLGSNQQDTEGAQRFIDQQIGEYELKLRKAEIKVANYRRKHAVQLGNSDRNVRSMEAAESLLEQLHNELQAVTWQRNQLSVRLATVPKHLSIDQAPETDPVRAGMEQQLLALRSELGRLLTQFTDRHPDIIASRNRIAQSESSLAALPQRQGGGMKGSSILCGGQISSEVYNADLTIGSLQTRQVQVSASIEVLSHRVAETPAAEAELVHLTRDYEVMVNQHEKLIERRESARLGQRMSAEAESVEFRIVEPPIVPLGPSAPPRLIFSVVVLFLGCGAGIGAAVLRILLTDAFMGSRQLSKAIGLPVIGVLPISRSMLSARRKFVEAIAAACITAALFLSAGSLGYYYLSHSAPLKILQVFNEISNETSHNISQIT
ncbi:MAG: hypothetical protein ACKVJ1_12715 [Verrucomicrobiia bacterium]